MQELKGQAKQGAERREAIVDAALEVFAQRGYRSGALDGDRGEGRSHPGRDPVPLRFQGSAAAGGDRRARPVEPARSSPSSPSHAGLASLREVVQFADLSEREPGLTVLHAVLLSKASTPSPRPTPTSKNAAAYVRGLVEKTLRDAASGRRSPRRPRLHREGNRVHRVPRRRGRDVAARPLGIARRVVRELHRRRSSKMLSSIGL